MDIHDDVKKVTLLSLPDRGKFFHLKGLSQAEKDRKMNERQVKTPRNAILLESDAGDNNQEADISNEINPTLRKHEISAAIKEVNGGFDLSNKEWAVYWAKHLEEITKSETQKSYDLTSDDKDTEASSEDQAEDNNSASHKLKKQKKKIFKNAAFMGLVNTNKIALEDLINSNKQNCINEKDRLKTSDTQTDDEHNIQFVPLREDPEVFIHPLRMGIDVKKYKDIDFTVQRVGIKIKETPQQYFLRTTNDDSFEFVRKKNNGTVKK